MTDTFRPEENLPTDEQANRPENISEEPPGNALDEPNNYLEATNEYGDLDNLFTDEPHDTDDAAKNQMENNQDEETAQELTPELQRPSTPSPLEEERKTNPEVEQAEIGRTALGWTALVLSVMALFFFPVLLGSAGAITGFFAYRNGARTLGMWSMALGILAILIGLFFIPYYVNTL